MKFQCQWEFNMVLNHFHSKKFLNHYEHWNLHQSSILLLFNMIQTKYSKSIISKPEAILKAFLSNKENIFSWWSFFFFNCIKMHISIYQHIHKNIYIFKYRRVHVFQLKICFPNIYCLANGVIIIVSTKSW